VPGSDGPSAETLLRPALAPGFALLALVLAVGYWWLVRVRGARHPDHPWPPGRSVAFGAGVAVIVVATQSGLAAYDTVSFSVHMAQHLLLGMVAPLLLVLGAPVTLALQGSRRPVQVTLLRGFDHPVVRVLTHPVVAWALFSLSLFGLYFTPLLELSLRNGPVHVVVHLHFLASGFLFCWSVLAVDVGRRRPSHGARLLAVALTIPIHAFLGLAIYAGADRPLGGDVYVGADRTWGGSPAADQRAGAALMWGIGELWGVLLVLLVAMSWMAADARRQARDDVRLDRSLRAAVTAPRSSPR
jgi:putative membrane protein